MDPGVRLLEMKSEMFALSKETWALLLLSVGLGIQDLFGFKVSAIVEAQC